MSNQDKDELLELEGPWLKCHECDRLTFNDFKYCSSCGKKRLAVSKEVKKVEITSDKNFISLLSYFFITIGVLSFSSFWEFSPDETNDFYILIILLAALDIGYALYNGKPSFLFSTKELKFKKVLEVLGVLTIAGVAVHYLADFLNAALFDDYQEVQYITGDNWGVTILLIAVYPAFLEEISFRGFLFHNVEKLSNQRAAIIVTSLIFGITHLSFVSMIWHVPLGYYFAHYRAKYNTLWYGVIGHFFYNTFVTLIDLVL